MMHSEEIRIREILFSNNKKLIITFCCSERHNKIFIKMFFNKRCRDDGLFFSSHTMHTNIAFYITSTVLNHYTQDKFSLTRTLLTTGVVFIAMIENFLESDTLACVIMT